MDTALETPASKELTNLTPEQQRKLEADRSRGNGQFPQIPAIRLSNKDMTQAPEGNYFIETKKGKDEPADIRDIGKNPELVILYKTVTYSYFDEQNQELVAWTSDIHGYGDNPVTLFLKVNGKVTIDFEGTFNQFKAYRSKFDILHPVTKEKTGSNLTFKNVLYVLFEGKPYKMFVSNASAVGIQPDGRPSFDKPQSRSLQYFTDMCWNDQKALYDYAVTMDSRLVKKAETAPAEPDVIYAQVPKPFYIMRFESVRQLEGAELATAIDASIAAEKAIYTIDRIRKEQVMEDQHKTTKEEALDVFGDDPTAPLAA